MHIDIHVDKIQANMSNCQWAMLMYMIEDFGAALRGPPVEGAEAEEVSQNVAALSGEDVPSFTLGFCVEVFELQLTKVGVIPPDQLHRRQRLTIIPLCVFKLRGLAFTNVS